MPLIPTIRPFRIKNKKTEKPIINPPVNADMGVKLIMFIKSLKLEKPDSFFEIIFDILV